MAYKMMACACCGLLFETAVGHRYCSICRRAEGKRPMQSDCRRPSQFHCSNTTSICDRCGTHITSHLTGDYYCPPEA